MRNGFRLRVLVSAVALALTTSVAAGAASVPASAVTLSGSHTIYISVANRYLTMPHRVAAGQYYAQVRTTDAQSVVQIVRPPAGYTTGQFLAAATRWYATDRSGADPTAAYAAFLRSVNFVGGVTVARGGVGAFATRLTAGTYWLYENTYRFPTHAARIVVLTVVGAIPAQTPVTSVGLVRFSATGGLTMPARLPTAGWLKGLGGALLNSLSVAKLLPGVTQSDLETRGVCYPAGLAPPTKDCFVHGTGANMTGILDEQNANLSAGASVYWYYRLTPGEYVAGNSVIDQYHNESWDMGGYQTRFTVS